MTEAPPDLVRRAIAAAALASLGDGPGATPARVGGVELRPHQRAALGAVEAAIREFGGALLADEVGLGKTYVALAAARAAGRLLVVAPAVLRAMWTAAAERVGRAALTFVSFEQLSRADGDPAGAATHDFLIVDEAHHVRTPATRRYARLATLTAGRVPVLLLSATPVHNQPRDLAALLALFLGARAHALGAAELARCVVRRERSTVDPAAALPAVLPPEWLPAGDAAALLDVILRLPPPLPPIDAGDGGALVVHSLVRQWASSVGALRAALRRRLARAAALRAALESGRWPTRQELGAWTHADGALQLAFPEFAAPAARGPDGTRAALAAVQAHEGAVAALLQLLRAHAALDQARAERIRELRRRHPRAKVVAFSAYADTVDALARELRGDAGVCALTATGARVAGGRLTRAEALARFAPRAHGARPPAPAEAIDLLLTTDLLSEGVNLQDASVVVHLDLPWTAARLEQRVGRVARLGSEHAAVAVYAMAPPASTARLLATERAIRGKLRTAARLVGVAGVILPPALDASVFSEHNDASRPAADASAPQHGDAIRQLLTAWHTEAAPAGANQDEEATVPAGPLVAAVAAPHAGLLAAVQLGARCLLLAAAGGGALSDDPAAVRAALGAGRGRARPVHPLRARAALVAVHRWCASRAARGVAGVVGGLAGGARRHVVARIARITRDAPSHQRPLLAPLAVAARQAAAAPCGAGAERVLGELAGASAMPDEAWLRAVAAFGSVHARDRSGADDASAARTPRVVALLLLEADAGS